MKKTTIFLINIYRTSKNYIYPMLGFSGATCKYYPSCSEYTKQCVEEYGVLKGICLGTKRVVRCNPFSKGGYDPVHKGGS
ncbi:MAG: membrane protein insertion efficiency factor YidD [Oscillospiraceae bacterium]|nr:membrane protein insertion efficiency factor YidD [Oscillospiraceae bacterium]